jgi:hypothetical protein
VPQFAQWNDHKREDAKNFSKFREVLRSREKLAEPSLYLELRGKRKSFENSVRYYWNSPAIPALEKLGDLERAEDTAVLEHLISANKATRPTDRWMKATLALIDVVGRKEFERRLHEWLSIFHHPIVNRDIFGDGQNCYNLDYVIDRCNSKFPDWPTLISSDSIKIAGRALALELASGMRWDVFSEAISLKLFRHREIYYAKKPKLSTALDVYPHQRTTNDSIRAGHKSSYIDWQAASAENEQLLKFGFYLRCQISSQRFSH